jgi:hypothetical protein
MRPVQITTVDRLFATRAARSWRLIVSARQLVAKREREQQPRDGQASLAQLELVELDHQWRGRLAA